ncbi:hypothetical protein GCM10023257_27070 [Streptomyces hyderabadensis]|uniref:Uncharacterized protein n=1 Tax=Streptomyces hyderabadensis TaxID=598549 RepID=A0ABP9I2J5_9ACTN
MPSFSTAFGSSPKSFCPDQPAHAYDTGPGTREVARRLLCGLAWRGPEMTEAQVVTWAFFMERVTRIELALSAWEATALDGRPGP